LSKRHCEQILEVYGGIFRDITVAFPQLLQECERDLARMQLIASSRGMVGLAIDLPRLGKHFDRCLSDGQYTAPLLPFSGRKKKQNPIPKFLGGLMLLVFDDDGTLKEQASVEAIFFIRQVLYLAKKIELQCSQEDTTREIESFLELDFSIPRSKSEIWDSEDPSSVEVSAVYRGFCDPESELHWRISNATFTSGKGELLTKYLDFVFGYLSTSLGRYEPSEWKFRHGPGAISARPGRVNKYNWYSWPSRLDSMFPISEYGYYSHTSWLRNIHVCPEGEESSRLVAVRKTLDKPRLIAAEPSSHQWCQQNVWHFMKTRMGKHPIFSAFLRFNDQSLNQELCRKASVDGTLATLDLSSASDCVTCDLVGEAFRGNPNLLKHLIACRTRFVRVEHIDHGVFTHRLNKFSTMGSACTFPVEAFIFLGISIAATMFCRRLPMRTEAMEDLAGSLSVFGDDIIVPIDAWETVSTALECLHFKVNEAKSYAKGFFRESCGVDAYKGVNVSPVYVRRLWDGKPESVASALDTRNLFYQKWCMETCRVLERTFGGLIFPQIRPSSGVRGFYTFLDPQHLRCPFKHRYNEALQRGEVRIPTFTGAVSKQRDADDSLLHQFFTEEPSPYDKWEAGTIVSTATKIRWRWVPLHDILQK